MQKEFAFEALDIYGNREYWAASYPNKAMAISASKEYLSNRISHSATVLENKNAGGAWTAPQWVNVWQSDNLTPCYQCMKHVKYLFADSRCKACTRIDA